jgi:hypothetical protein
MQKFLQGLENTLKFVEKNRKARLKEQAERGEAPKRVARRRPGEDSDRAGAPRAAAKSDETAKAKPKRVKVIAKKDLKKE